MAYLTLPIDEYASARTLCSLTVALNTTTSSTITALDATEFLVDDYVWIPKTQDGTATSRYLQGGRLHKITAISGTLNATVTLTPALTIDVDVAASRSYAPFMTLARRTYTKTITGTLTVGHVTIDGLPVTSGNGQFAWVVTDSAGNRVVVTNFDFGTRKGEQTIKLKSTVALTGAITIDFNNNSSSNSTNNQLDYQSTNNILRLEA